MKVGTAALVAAGALLGLAGVAVAQPSSFAPDGTKVLNQRSGPRLEAPRFYRLTLNYTGTTVFTRKSLSNGLIQTETTKETGTYTVKSRPIAVSATCVGPYSKLRRILDPRLRRGGISCHGIRDRLPRPLSEQEIDELDTPDQAPGRLPSHIERIKKAIDRSHESYQFGPVFMSGSIPAGERIESTDPLTVIVPGNPRPQVCDPRASKTRALLTQAQTGLAVRARSGVDATRRSSFFGLDIDSFAPRGDPASVTTFVTPVRCLTGDPASPWRTFIARSTTPGVELWTPPDLLTSRDRRLARERAGNLAVREPPGTFGKKTIRTSATSKITDTARVGEGVVRTTDTHTYELVLRRCSRRQGRTASGC